MIVSHCQMTYRLLSGASASGKFWAAEFGRTFALVRPGIVRKGDRVHALR